MECLRFSSTSDADLHSVSSRSISLDLLEIIFFGLASGPPLTLGNRSSLSMSASSSEEGQMDFFCWLVEGVLILVVGCIGLLGNSLSLVIFSRQKKHKIFHNLLLTLTIFDMLYIVCSILLFSISKFSERFDSVYRVHLLPYLLPLAHVGLTGSVYCTLSMTVERFLAVYYPFLRFSKRAYNSRTFILPVVAFTLLYNIPKFFELTVKTSCPGQDNANTTYILVQCDEDDRYIDIQPTEMRTNRVYIRVYILWMNLFVLIVIPFILLIVLNVQTYKKIKRFEQVASNSGNRACKNIANPPLPDVVEEGARNAIMITPTPSVTFQDNVDRIEEAPNEFLNSSEEGPFFELLQIDEVPESGSQESSSCNVEMHGSSHIISLRRREVVFAKISLYIVFVFLVCHGVRLFPNTFEMMQTYMEDYNPNTIDFPLWMHRVTNLSHFLLAFASSANFFIYFAKHGHVYYGHHYVEGQATKAIQTDQTWI